MTSDVIMFALIAFGILLLLSLWWWYQYYYYFKDMLSIPTPLFVLPIFGNLFEVRYPVDSFWVLHKFLMTVGRGKAIRGTLGFFFGLVIIDPVFLEHIMNHSSAMTKSKLYKFVHNWLGSGLLTSSGEKWYTRRKLLTPAYHFKILEQFIDVFDKNSNILVQHLQPMEGMNRVNIYPYINLCALDVICETAMGTSVNAQLNTESQYVKATREMKRIAVERGVSLIKLWDVTYRVTADYRIEKKMLKILHDYTHSVIVTRRNELIKEEQNVKKKQRIPFLDLLLQSSLNGAQLSDEDIREEVDTFMFEGHDTVSAAVSFCIYNISKHANIQNRLMEEQKQIFADEPLRVAVHNDLLRMKYMAMVIKESLRLYPSVALIGRHVTSDIKYDKMIIKKGTEIGISTYSVHRNPDIYPNPEVFDPERFTSEACAQRHPFAYIPFSAGFRNCIGQKFAMLEMKSLICKLLRHFEFTDAPNSDLRLTSEIIISSATGVHVGIQKRIW